MEAQGEAGVASLSSPSRRRAGVSRRVESGNPLGENLPALLVAED